MGVRTIRIDGSHFTPIKFTPHWKVLERLVVESWSQMS